MTHNGTPQNGPHAAPPTDGVTRAAGTHDGMPTARMTRSGQIRLALRLARRLARSRPLARSVSIVFVAALLVMAMFVTLRTLSLSGEQVADNELGRFGAKVGYGSGVALLPGDDTFVTDLRARLRDAGVTGAEVVLSATDVQLNTTPARNVTALETAWTTQPYPERYNLLSGRWPSSPGEVAVTEPRDVRTPVGQTLTVLGDVRLKVVGTVDDRAADTTNLLLGPGTWAALDPALSTGFPVLNAQMDVMWPGERQSAAVDAFTAAARTWAQDTKDNADAAALSQDAHNAVAATLVTRDQLLGRPQKTWIEKTPAGYTVPSLLVPTAAVALVFGLNGRRFRRTTASLTSVGISRTTAAAGPALAALAWSLVAAACGAVAGLAVGIVARLIVSRLRERPAGPLDDLATPALRLLAVVLVTGLTAAVLLARTRRDGSPRPHRDHDSAPRPGGTFARRARDARHLLAVAAWCATAVYATRVDSPAQAMVLTGILIAAVLLTVPEVFAGMLRLLPEGGPRRRLVRRQLAADRGRACAALAVLTVLFGASLGYVTLLDTLIRTVEKQSYPAVLPGQVLLAGHTSDTYPPGEALLRTADSSGALDGLPRTEVRYLMSDDLDNPRMAVREGNDGSLLAADSPRDVERLIGRRLDARQTSVLRDGGLLVWSHVTDAPAPGNNARLRLAVRQGDKALGRTPELPATAVDVARAEWRTGSDGIMLRTTATALRLPLQADGPVMVTGVPDTKARALQQAVITAGIDAGAVLIHMEPDDPVPPAALLATAVGLVFLALAAVLAATRSQTRILRGYLARLIAVGIPPRWARQILLCQHGALIAVSTLLGLIIAVVPSAVLAARISGSVLSVPWWQLAVLAAAIYLAALLAAAHSAHRLRATEAWRA
ncbi:hypothetical protein [Streptomyces sp. TRM68416]|uniref:hypothetical protein n=1 Tax=Streptomyces sp. TRM68416 TaxID=2758412 RepID=UPI001661CD7C|nr:hypothetical protein [Streptomyces sp. TRM68416]MBD0842374.1 hypothetical protein [Streptomyces sp. TRM68416]